MNVLTNQRALCFKVSREESVASGAPGRLLPTAPKIHLEIMEIHKEKSESVTPDCFHDFAVRLSEVEWKLLHDWQTELYELVMKELQEAVNSLGPLIATAIFTINPKKKNDCQPKDNQQSESLQPTDNQESEIRQPTDNQQSEMRDGAPSPQNGTFSNPNVLFRRQRKTKRNRKNNQDTSEQESTTGAGLPLLDADIDMKSKQSSDSNLLNNSTGEVEESLTTSSAVYPEHDIVDSVETDPGLSSEKMQPAHQQPEEGTPQQHLPVEEAATVPEANVPEAPTEYIQLRHPSSMFPKTFKEGVLAKLLIVRPEISPKKDEEPILNIFDRFGEEIRKYNTNPILSCEGISFHINNLAKTQEIDRPNNKRSESPSSPTSEECLNMKRQACAHKTTARKCVPGKDKVAGFRRALKETISRRLQWSMSNHQPRERKSTQDESGVKHPELSGVPQGTSKSGESDSKPWNKKRRGRPRKQTYVKQFSCPECPQCFKLKHHLTRHRRIHSGERPHHCEVCRKSFSERHHLTQHQRLHSQERPFKCAKCGKGFSSKKNLNKHRIWQHVKKNVTWGPDPAV